MGQRVSKWSKPKLISGGGVNTSLKRALLFSKLKIEFFKIENRIEYLLLDPKPSDLVMSRLKI